MAHRYYAQRFQDRLISGLRISLGLIFFWFGALKVAGYNPVYEIVNASFPIFATPTGNIALGLVEAAIGLGLLANLFAVVLHVALLGHLAGTFSVFFLAPDLMFQPHFPILTLSGEFVFKNATLAMAGIVTLAYHHRH